MAGLDAKWLLRNSILHQLPEATTGSNEKDALKKFAIFTEKFFLESLFNNVAADADEAFILANLLKGESTKPFSSEHCEIFKNTYFEEHCE